MAGWFCIWYLQVEPNYSERSDMEFLLRISLRTFRCRTPVSVTCQRICSNNTKHAINFGCYNGQRSCRLSQFHNVLFQNCQNVLTNSPSRGFRTTARCRMPIPPAIWLLVKPVLKLFSALTARSLRGYWWSLLTSEEKKRVFKKSKFIFGGVSAALALLVTVYYVSHIEETPITHRRRYIAFSEPQFERIAAIDRDKILEECKDNMLPDNHPLCVYVVNMVERISEANKDLECMVKQKWKVRVIHSVEQNAFVLPTGEIFVMTGLLTLLSNEDQLAFIIAHEMAHALLNHIPENLSYAQLVDFLAILALGAIWFLMPADGVAAVSHYFYQRLTQVMLNLPYERKLETEADVVGLQLMAKACYDIREGSRLWALLSYMTSLAEEAEGEEGEPEWLSTHPTHEHRADYLATLLPEAYKTRCAHQCPPLDPKYPPEDNTFLLRTIMKASREKQLLNASKESPAAK